MDEQSIFWILVVFTAIELMAIYLIGSAIKSVLKSDFFKRKLEEKRNDTVEKEKGMKNQITLTVILLLISNPFLYYAADPDPIATELINVSRETIYYILAIDIVLLGVVWYLKNLMFSIVNIGKKEEKLIVTKPQRKRKTLVRILTDAVPLEEEESVETDHIYDGIRELDNNLPPWWKWGFYVSIIFAIVYMFNYHVFKTGDLQIEAYQKEVKKAEKDIQIYLASQAMNVDENTAVFMTEKSDIDNGKSLFKNYCAVCHGSSGEGVVGPNLTDQYWLYGGGIKDVFRTIKYGAQRGMKSWKDELNPIQIQQVSSFIVSLRGSKPVNPKEPEGELFEIEEKKPISDSTESVVRL